MTLLGFRVLGLGFWVKGWGLSGLAFHLKDFRILLDVDPARRV